MKQYIVLFIAFIFLFSNCSSSDNEIEPEQLTPKEPKVEYYTIAYLPTWKKGFIPEWNKITHLCLAFGLIQADGTVDMSQIDQLKDVMRLARNNNVKILLSVGGGGTTNFSAAILDVNARNKLVNNLSNIVDNYDLDGLDIDFEEWDGGMNGASEKDLKRRSALEETYKALRSKVGKDKLITAAVTASWDKGDGSWGYYNCFNNTMHEYLDFVNLMIYDETGPWSGSKVGSHSSWEYYENAIQHWLEKRKLPKEKLIPGVPFYGYQFKSPDSAEGAKAISYADIIESYADQNAHLKDNVGLIYYDGMPTIEKKAKFVKENKLGGIMIWEISHDSKNKEKSLLNVIYETFKD